MSPAGGALLSLAYIFGLLLTAILGSPTRPVPWTDYGLLCLGVVVLSIVAAIAIPRFWRTGPKPKLWLAAGIIAALALVYFQARVPKPVANDVSQFVRSRHGIVQEQVVTVQGRVKSTPHLTRSSKAQFWLEATQLTEVESRDKVGATSKGVTGKLYVTVPMLQATGLYPGQTISVTGVLYKPKPVSNPGAFDFETYLAKEGSFAGFSGRQVSFFDEGQGQPWGWWKLRQRIIRAQVRQLISPAGQLVSSMVLGNQVVDIPYDIRDQFIKAGLAHALAASGTQTSLILGLVLVLTKRLSVKAQLGFGTGALLIFVGLTGLQPSVLRAAIMGFGALIALVTQRKVKPLGSLLVAATILLLFNPLWIWDLGFQLSFLATLGLLITAPPLTKTLDWLPLAIASLIAITIAASLWTLPLQLYVFNMFAPYSITANILCAPFIAVISIGSIVSALAALIAPIAGSALAGLLYYPTQLLIMLVHFFNELPGSIVAVGKISLIQLLLLYSLIGISSINKKWQKRWWLVGLVAVSLIALPVWQTKISQFQATVFATEQEQVLVIQDQGKVALVNSGEVDTVSFTVLPFLQKQGVNHIDWAIALDSEPRLRSGWLQILTSLPVRSFYDIAAAQSAPAETKTIASAIQAQKGNYQRVSTGQRMFVGSTPIELINVDPPVLQFQLRYQSWLLLGEMKSEAQQQLIKSRNIPPVQVLWWSGESLAPDLLKALQPKVAIASSKTVDLDTAKLLQRAKIPLYWTGRDGAIEWTPQQGFETTIEATNKDAPLL
ncbi:ComEC/Rec2 family competence protein [Allocoleopsis sp.]|uniref:ComEC/Rec2 family competence protein n=1 Tax=Allocoleopsis sp. TaxID=3088169 RepID=UPI002FCF8D5D